MTSLGLLAPLIPSAPDRFAERWNALRDAVCGRLAPGVTLPGAGKPPPMYLASARSSHWSAIGGDADGWLAFLEPWATFDRSLAAITHTRSGNPPPIAKRIDLTLADGPPSLGERGRLRCCPSDLTAVFRRLLAYPVEHVLIRLTSTDPCRDLTEVRGRWETRET
ncbi:MAG TPA: hypothetical protein VFR40_06995 [Lapillicoccus sp.]|nr:hypothetical protein [Lapillicoccus sp.]